jgi:hypothetical protein
MSSMLNSLGNGKPSGYLLLREMERYCPDRTRVMRALAILDSQDVTGDDVVGDPCEWPAWQPDASHDQPETFSPSEQDLRWAAAAFELPDGPTDQDWDDFAAYCATQDALEAFHHVTDQDLVNAGLPIG